MRVNKRNIARAEATPPACASKPSGAQIFRRREMNEKVRQRIAKSPALSRAHAAQGSRDLWELVANREAAAVRFRQLLRLRFWKEKLHRARKTQRRVQIVQRVQSPTLQLSLKKMILELW